jgi:hypothetical protein
MFVAAFVFMALWSEFIDWEPIKNHWFLLMAGLFAIAAISDYRDYRQLRRVMLEKFPNFPPLRLRDYYKAHRALVKEYEKVHGPLNPRIPGKMHPLHRAVIRGSYRH